MAVVLSLALVAMAAAAPVPAASARWVRSGKIVVGRGAGPLRLYMTRAQVVARLGRPFYENANGYMQYEPDRADNIFDAYLRKPADRVRMLIVAQGRFTVRGTRIFRRGDAGRLRRIFGRRLRAMTSQTGESLYRIVSRYRGRTTWTDFVVDRAGRASARVIDVYVLFPYF